MRGAFSIVCRLVCSCWHDARATTSSVDFCRERLKRGLIVHDQVRMTALQCLPLTTTPVQHPSFPPLPSHSFFLLSFAWLIGISALTLSCRRASSERLVRRHHDQSPATTSSTLGPPSASVPHRPTAVPADAASQNPTVWRYLHPTASPQPTLSIVHHLPGH